MEHPSYYGILPARVRYDKKLPPMARIMYAEITALSNKHGYCSAGNDYFAKLYEVSTVSVSRWVSSLVKCGHIWLDADPLSGQNRKIYANETAAVSLNKNVTTLNKNDKAPLTKMSQTLNKNDKHNNTREIIQDKIEETPNGEHPFSKIAGLEQRIGQKQYELLRKISPENLEAMRGMFHDGRVEMLWRWLEHKKTKGAYRAVNGITETVNMLKEYTPDELRVSLSEAIRGNYAGWFPKKEQQPKPKPDAPIRNLPSGQRRRID